jgi:acetyl esterase
MTRNCSVFSRFFLACLLGLLAAAQSALALAEHPIKTHQDVQWAQPKGFPLTLDIHVPDTGKKRYPVLIIYHGGGWLVNTNRIMDDMARYMAANGELVVVNVNYRLLGDVNNTTTMNEIVEDALGAVLWVKDNIKRYGGDPKKIAVTGDSAGGHLAAMVVMTGRHLESDGFAGDSLGFNPTYLPAKKTAEKVARRDGARVQAAILSYSAFDIAAAARGGFESPNNPFWQWGNATARGLFGAGVSLESRPDFYEAASPLNYIPQAKKYRLPPQFVLVGSNDQLTTPESAKDYVEKVTAAGHKAELKIYPGRGHGYLDSGCNEYTGGCFKDLATETLDDMIAFLNRVLR